MTIEESEINYSEIKYYKVATNYTSNNRDSRRSLFLSSVDPRLDNSNILIENVFIDFQLPENWHIKNNAHVIGHVLSNGKKIELVLPVSEFEDMYKILQTEKPVYFYWRTEKNKPWLTLFGLSSTDSEMPGEGLEDSSWFGVVPPSYFPGLQPTGEPPEEPPEEFMDGIVNDSQP